jgi:RNA methyltransferase, TrmH family
MTRLQSLISSHHNDWFKSVMRLHQSSERRDQRKFLIEGTHLVEEAIATGWPLECLCFIEAWAEQNQNLMNRITTDPSRDRMILQPATKDILSRLSTTTSRTPVVGVAHLYERAPKPQKQASLALAVESLQDPGNLGSLIRISAAAGVGQVYISEESVAPTNPKVLRSTAGQWFRSPPIVTDLKQFLKVQKAASWQILAACADGKSYWETDLTQPTLFLLGNEGGGLSSEMISLATDKVSIPMAASVESLNVSVAGALLLYEAQRQRLVGGSANS